MAKKIEFILFDAFQLLDLSGPIAAFHAANEILADSYTFQLRSADGGTVRSSAGVEVGTIAVDDAYCGTVSPDTLIVPGGPGVFPASQTQAYTFLVYSLARGARRIASVCTGAFMLAAAGIVHEHRVTTHWQRAAQLQKWYPKLRVESDKIYIQDGSIWSSAGVTAGIDLTLALIEQDLGRDVAQTVARKLVVYYRRPGGQAQFSALLDLEPQSDRIHAVLAYARNHLHEPLPVRRLAEAARLSPRQFARTFIAETGQTPAKAIERMRSETARPRVEDGREQLEMIARDVGFSDAEQMRRGFIRAFGLPPQALRRAAAAAAARGHPDIATMSPLPKIYID